MSSKDKVKPPGPNVNDPLANAIDQFRVDALLAHNIYREKHESVPLQHCRVLSDYAQMWANRIAKEDKLIHSTPDYRLQYNKVMLGENLVATTDFKITGKGYIIECFFNNNNSLYKRNE